MLPKAIEAKAIEAIQRMERGCFSEDDIELLLIRLREYSNAKSIFREISHFIAHHKRDSGLTFLSLYRVYCRMRAYGEFQYHKKPLDLSSPIDKWFYDFVLFQLDEIESHVLKKKYGFSRKQAKRIFKEFFSEERNGYSYTKSPSKDLVNIVNEASSFIKIKPLFSPSEIVSSFTETFKSLGLLQDTKSFEAQSDKLILGLLVLMHKREFHIGKDVFGKTELDFPADGFGKLKKLELKGTIQVPDLAAIGVTLIETSLDFDTWCEPDLLVQKETNIKGHYWTVFDETSDFTIGENDKLQRL
ncbi:hypothetical protein DEU29_1562 [Idiomarina aquatica]|uniref:Uncharacterized protein n=1 Tax=Idiomarina aquatica TaxID=1327752 RepID=A0A4R6NW35_9GAMM|nr:MULTISPECIES: hypothetical protein [Idiomarina]TDP26153.1 hypothetical protein DEU29_1562 [Idiomarina aquatica]